MTPAALRVLLLLRAGQQLLRGPLGWRVARGAGFERVDTATARELLAEAWVEEIAPTGTFPLVYRISAAGRRALEEPCQS